MAPEVITHTHDELVTRRTQLLAALGVGSVIDADARAAADDMSGEQMLLLDALHDVEFLLGGKE